MKLKQWDRKDHKAVSPDDTTPCLAAVSFQVFSDREDCQEVHA